MGSATRPVWVVPTGMGRGEGGGGGSLRGFAVDESRNETAGRVAEYQADKI